MERSKLVLAAMAAARGASLTPVQAQKLFFLIDKKIPSLVGGPHFNFEPYDYGPFDHAVYREIEALSAAGQAEVVYGGVRTFRLTAEGQAEGERHLAGLHESAGEYLRSLVAWIRTLSFSDLVSSIYREFPEMKEKSIFREAI